MTYTPTIFVTMSDGEVSKSILHTDIFPLLKKRARVVFLVHKNKAAYFKDMLGTDADVEIMPQAQMPRIEEFLLDLMLYSVPTQSIRVKIEHSFHSGGSQFGRAIKYILWFFGHLRMYRALVRALYRCIREHSFDELITKYKPDLVFAANLTAMEDARLLKTARTHKIRSIGMPKGWDNLTLKTLLPVFPDKLLVQTPLLKSDAKHLDYPESRITIVGFPKFDVYATHNLRSREEFVSALGLDPSRKVILYAGAGDVLAPFDEDILARFLHAIDDGAIPGKPQVIVRPHPKYLYRTDILPQSSSWVLDRPGKVVGARTMDFEFTKDDVEHLTNSLFHADLVIHTASTLGVEAAIFDKPTISIGFEEAHISRALSTSRYYKYEHYSRVVATGGMPVAHSFDELVRLTNEYLADPAKDRAGRASIVRDNAFNIDGKAGERVADAILRMVEK